MWRSRRRGATGSGSSSHPDGWPIGTTALDLRGGAVGAFAVAALWGAEVAASAAGASTAAVGPTAVASTHIHVTKPVSIPPLGPDARPGGRDKDADPGGGSCRSPNRPMHYRRLRAP